jgi:HlyD family secretion protein
MEIETISLNVGELATAGYALFNGYIPKQLISFTIPESKISKFQKGMIVNMKSTYGNQEFSGKIVSIKQLTKYADITTAFPDYQPEDAVYEIK